MTEVAVRTAEEGVRGGLLISRQVVHELRDVGLLQTIAARVPDQPADRLAQRCRQLADGLRESGGVVAGVVLGRRREHGGKHRQADRAADLLADVEQRRGQAGVGVGDLGHRDRGERYEEESHGKGEHQHAGKQRSEVARAGVDRREPQQRDRQHTRADDDQDLGPEPRQQLRDNLRGDADDQGDRQEREARLQCAVVAHALDEERDEVEHAEHRGTDDQHHQVCPGAAAVLEDPHRHHRRGRAVGLEKHEADQQHHCRGEHREGLGVAPAGVRDVDEAVDE